MIQVALDNINTIIDYDINNYLVAENNVLSLMEKDNYDLINKLEELEYPIYFTYNQILSYIEMDKSLQYKNKKMLLDIIDDTVYKLITITEDYENEDDKDIESQKNNLFSVIDSIIERYEYVYNNTIYKNKRCEYMINIFDDMVEGFKTAGKYLYFRYPRGLIDPNYHPYYDTDTSLSDTDTDNNDSDSDNESDSDNSDTDNSDTDNETSPTPSDEETNDKDIKLD
tara:strand:+ start:258 stop:935 length:678 start_codon:yes stop_codon:yes gene_type:complete